MPASFDFPEGAAGAFTEGTFYPAFQQDLARAHESVVIFSPFATGPGTGRWVDPLRAALARGVRVRILTRPPEEPGGGTTDEVGGLVSGLRDLGVTVDLRARMHEKIAILDGRILWLNILSHRDTHESMLRIESPAARPCGTTVASGSTSSAKDRAATERWTHAAAGANGLRAATDEEPDGDGLPVATRGPLWARAADPARSRGAAAASPSAMAATAASWAARTTPAAGTPRI
jgi:hypothetical protein